MRISLAIESSEDRRYFGTCTNTREFSSVEIGLGLKVFLRHKQLFKEYEFKASGSTDKRIMFLNMNAIKLINAVQLKNRTVVINVMFYIKYMIYCISHIKDQNVELLVHVSS